MSRGKIREMTPRGLLIVMIPISLDHNGCFPGKLLFPAHDAMMNNPISGIYVYRSAIAGVASMDP